MRKGAKIFVGIGLSVVALLLLYIFFKLDPAETSLFPRCPFLMITGYECPGCGSQRAIHQLLHLNIASALKYNAFVVMAIPYLFLALYMEYFGGKVRFPNAYVVLYGKNAAIVILVFIVLFWIVRNLM